MPSSFLHLPGAVEASDSGVAAHYGAPLIEQRALEAGDAIVDLGHHEILTVSGPDRLSWMHSFTSQSLTGLRPGESVETLLLDANGRIEHPIRAIDDGERLWLLVDPGHGAALLAFLLRMRFALRVEIEDRSADFATLHVSEGGAAAPALESLGIAAVAWHDPWGSIVRGGAQYAERHPGEGWNAIRFVVPRTELDRVSALVDGTAIRVAGLLALDALEIRAARPSAAELDERAIPHEFDWLRSAVHLTKGCYRGQETVAKVHNLGHPPRRLVLLHLDGSAGELPEGGALVFRAGESAEAEARPVGRVTRAGLHHEWGGIALALLKRSVPEDAALEVRLGDGPEAVAAAQEIVVPADAGATRGVPRLPRI